VNNGQLKAKVKLLLEAQRKAKVLVDEMDGLKADLLEEMNTRGETAWQDEEVKLSVVDQVGQERVAIADLRAALGQQAEKFIVRGQPSRYVKPGWR